MPDPLKKVGHSTSNKVTTMTHFILMQMLVQKKVASWRYKSTQVWNVEEKYEQRPVGHWEGQGG